MKCEIRNYQSKDLESVMNIWLQANLTAHKFIPAEYWVGQYEAVKEALPQAEIFIYEEAKKVVGFLGMQQGYIAGLFIEGSCQSRGIGKALLDAVKVGKEELTLHAYTENDGAVRFYEREGFQKIQFKKEETTGREEVLMHWKGTEKQPFKKEEIGV